MLMPQGVASDTWSGPAIGASHRSFYWQPKNTQQRKRGQKLPVPRTCMLSHSLLPVALCFELYPTSNCSVS